MHSIKGAVALGDRRQRMSSQEVLQDHMASLVLCAQLPDNSTIPGPVTLLVMPDRPAKPAGDYRRCLEVCLWISAGMLFREGQPLDEPMGREHQGGSLTFLAMALIACTPFGPLTSHKPACLLQLINQEMNGLLTGRSDSTESSTKFNTHPREW
jgi:hypothetical protein